MTIKPQLTLTILEKLMSVFKKSRSTQNALHLTLLGALLSQMHCALAQESMMHFDIPAMPLNKALLLFGKQSQQQILYGADMTGNLQSKALQGDYSPTQALEHLLSGLPVQAVADAQGTLSLQPKRLTKQNAVSETEITLGKVKVSASSIKEEEDENSPYNTSYNRKNSSTATKTDTPIMETPASIQVVTQQILHDQQAYRLEDAIKNVSGVQTYHAYGGDHENFVMRGFLQSTVNYRNGVRIPFTKFDLANVDRIEVLKGASAMMYGFGDPGGMISTFTKQPTDTPHYSIEQRFGSYDFYRTEASATGALSKKHGLNYRIDFSYLDKESFRNYMGNDRVFFAPTVSWELTPDTKLTFSYEHYEDNNAYDYGNPAIGNQLAKIPISRGLTGVDGNRNNTNNNLYDFRIDHRVNDNVKLNAGAVASQYDKYWNGVYLATVNATPGINYGNIDRRQWLGPEKGNTLTSWINGTFDFKTYGVKHKLLLGGEYFTNDVNYQVASGNKIDTINIFNPNIAPVTESVLDQFRNLKPNSVVDNDSNSKALYFQDQLTFWDTLHIMGGIRHDWIERNQSLSWWATPADPSAGTDSRTDDFVSPRVGILYETTDWLSLFGSFSESFGPANDYDNGGRKLYELFTATQFEGGLKTQFFDGKLNANLVYFDLERTQFFQDPNSVNNPFLSIPVKGKSRGVEFDVQGKIYKGLSLIGTYAYTDAKITNDATAPANVGNRLPYAPIHQGSAWLKYEFENEFLKGFSFGGGVYAAGKRYGDPLNSYFDPAYARLDLMAGYKRKLGDINMTSQLNFYNVNDAEYYVLRSRRTNLPAEPLTVMGSVKLEF
jgi:iron complex outermembrane receptor protein